MSAALEEHVGAISRMVSVHDEDETERAERLARWRAEQAVHRWYSDQATLNSATFPIYAAEDWLARINGQGSSNGQLTQITIAHAESMPDPLFAGRPPIEITTSINTYPSEDLVIARDTYQSRVESDISQEPTDGLSDAALTLWFRANRRRRVAASYAASVDQVNITIDGTPEPFVRVGSALDQWVAVRQHHDVKIVIAAHQIDPANLELEPIADLRARLLGPKPDEA